MIAIIRGKKSHVYCVIIWKQTVDHRFSPLKDDEDDEADITFRALALESSASLPLYGGNLTLTNLIDNLWLPRTHTWRPDECQLILTSLLFKR